MAKRERVVFQNAANNNNINKSLFRTIIERDIDKLKATYDGNTIRNAEFFTDKCTLLSPLALAVIHDYQLCCVKFLVKECGVNIEKGRLHAGRYSSPLWLAALCGRYDAVTYLVNEGGNVNARGGKDNLTPVGIACELGNYDMVKFLIENHRADAEIAANGGRTCLMIACENYNLRIAQYLLETVGTNVNRKDDKGRTVLHKCIGVTPRMEDSRITEVLDFLIHHDADINAKDEFGNTPLFLSIILDFKRCINYLRSVGGGLKEKIETLELSGAMAVKNDMDLRKAKTLWIWSLETRSQYPLLYTKSSSKEFTTIQEVKKIFHHRSNLYQIYIQVLLVFDRLLGPESPQALNFIADIVRDHADEYNLKLLMHTLENVKILNEATPDALALLVDKLTLPTFHDYSLVIRALEKIKIEMNAYRTHKVVDFYEMLKFRRAYYSLLRTKTMLIFFNLNINSEDDISHFFYLPSNDHIFSYCDVYPEKNLVKYSLMIGTNKAYYTTTTLPPPLAIQIEKILLNVETNPYIINSRNKIFPTRSNYNNITTIAKEIEMTLLNSADNVRLQKLTSDTDISSDYLKNPSIIYSEVYSLL